MSLAFASEEPYDASIITTLDIVEAESKFLIPIVGERLYDAMAAGKYANLVEEYAKPMVAAWVRYLIEPLIATRLCHIHGDGNITEAENDHSQRAQQALHTKAITLTRRLSTHLNSNCNVYAEYNPNLNPLNRCFIYGNLIQVR